MLNLEARVLLIGPFYAHCLSSGFVLEYDQEWHAYLPICDDWKFHLHSWIPAYIEKMKEDLISVGAWEICDSSG